MATTEVLSHLSVCGCGPVTDTRSLPPCSLPLKAEVMARVYTKVLHLVVPQSRASASDRQVTMKAPVSPLRWSWNKVPLGTGMPRSSRNFRPFDDRYLWAMVPPSLWQRAVPYPCALPLSRRRVPHHPAQHAPYLLLPRSSDTAATPSLLVTDPFRGGPLLRRFAVSGSCSPLEAAPVASP